MRYAALVLGTLAQKSQPEEKMRTVSLKKVTPILFAQEIEPCIKFWIERMGFEKTVEVPEGNKIGFAMLQKNGLEIMYQSYASVDKDSPSTGQAVRKGPAFLYIDVEDLDALITVVKDAEIVMPVRTTFYGAKEVGIKDPAGHYLIFAQQGSAGQH